MLSSTINRQLKHRLSRLTFSRTVPFCSSSTDFQKPKNPSRASLNHTENSSKRSTINPRKPLGKTTSRFPTKPPRETDHTEKPNTRFASKAYGHAKNPSPSTGNCGFSKTQDGKSMPRKSYDGGEKNNRSHVNIQAKTAIPRTNYDSKQRFTKKLDDSAKILDSKSTRSYDSGEKNKRNHDSSQRFFKKSDDGNMPKNNDRFWGSAISLEKYKTSPSDSKPASGTRYVKPRGRGIAKKFKPGLVNGDKDAMRDDRLKEAISVLTDLEKRNVRIELETYRSLIQLCCDTKAITEGRFVHKHMLKHVVNLPSKMLWMVFDMYVECGSLGDARQLFDEIPKRDFYNYKAIIMAYLGNGKEEKAVEMYVKMQEEGLKSDKHVLVSILKACARNSTPKFPDVAQMLEEEVVRQKLESDAQVAHFMIYIYGRRDKFDKAREVFDKMLEQDELAWSAIVGAYARQKLHKEAFEMVRAMCDKGMFPYSAMTIIILGLCGRPDRVRFGKEIHGCVVKGKIPGNVALLSALVQMYAKSGDISLARKLFDSLSDRDEASQNVIISICAMKGLHLEAMELFNDMRNQGLVPDRASWNSLIHCFSQKENSFVGFNLFLEMQQADVVIDIGSLANILDVCGQVADLERGKQTHGHIVRRGFDCSALMTANSLLSMYGMCGSIEDAERVFASFSKKDLVAWNSMISAYAKHGHAKEAFALYEEMAQKAEFRPDSDTFLGLISACSHEGLFKQGSGYFRSMTSDYNLTLNKDNYACMIDLLCREGKIKQAYDMLQNMPMEPSSLAWRTLLTACRIHLDIDLGELAARKLFGLEPENPSNYALLSELYSSLAMWEDVANVRRAWKEKGLMKSPGCSWIQEGSIVLSFTSKGQSQKQLGRSNAFLEELMEKIKKAGYVANEEIVPNALEGEEKENYLCGHSEKLAVAYSLLNKVKDKPIRIIKNLRMCDDCHDAVKFVSQISKQLISVKDSCRLHHFRNGKCSCGDYW